MPGDFGVEFDLSGYDLSNPANYIVRGIFDRRLRSKGTSIQWRGDLKLETDSDLFRQIDFGFRYNDRDAEFDNGTRYAFLQPQNVPITQAPIGTDGGLIRPGFRGSDIQPVRRWFAPAASTLRSDIDAFRDFARARLALTTDTGAQAAYASELPNYNPLERFGATERSYAVYGQFKYDLNLVFPIDGAIGVRAVNTVTQVTGTSRIGADFVPVSEEENYIDILPNFSARLKFTDRIQLRLSHTETRSRPTITQLNPSLNVDRENIVDPTSPLLGRGGNINLQPIQSKNYDASL